MIIDARLDVRSLGSEEFFIKLREILASKRGKIVSVEIFAEKLYDVKKIKTFVSMTGCQTAVEGSEGNYVINVTGTPCCI